MIDTEDRILNRWAHFAKNYSFLPLIGDGSTRIQPVYVVDVAAAIVAALKDDGSSMGKIYELGGPELGGLLLKLRSKHRQNISMTQSVNIRTTLNFHFPFPLLRGYASVCDPRVL
ncbi:NADH dehydrogenase [ubiquinone] 1 alpha subcomplex subunit 9, mitochondrial-like protein [Drosera capensis]